MVRFSIASTASSLLLLSSSASGFVVPPSKQCMATTNRAFVKPTTSTQLQATAPTLFIYWSMKTAFDTVAYGLGMTDEVKGTGVWNSFKLKSDKKDDEEDKDDEE